MNTKHYYRLSLIVLLFIFSGWNHGVWAQNDTMVQAQPVMHNVHVSIAGDTQPSDEFSAKRKHIIPERRHQISIGYGILSTIQLNTIVPYLFWCHIGDPVYPQLYTQRYTYGAIQIGYSFRITKVIGVGMYYVCEPRITKVYNEQLVCKLNLTTHTLLPTLKVNWLNKKVVTMYSKVGFGVTFSQLGMKNYQPEKIEINPDNQRVIFAYQLTLVGIELGNDQYAGFLQLGAGMEGWFCAGFRIRL